MKEMAVRWFTIEPVLTDRLETSRMTANINSVKAQMIGAGQSQFRDWIKSDAPFQAITANPKLSSQRRPPKPARPASPNLSRMR
jgi:hypothetical protein